MDERWAYLFLCLLAVVTTTWSQQFHTNTRYGKRTEMDSGNSKADCGEHQGRSQGRLEARNDRFFLGSRYGKRNYFEPLSNSEDSWNQVNQPSLRNDRFFMGSRYGKRDPPGDAEPDSEDSIARVFQSPCPVVN